MRTCKVVDCTKLRRMNGYCSMHAKELVDAETWASWKLRHCKVPGCTAKIVLRQNCEEHGRKELGDERFDILLSARQCKETGCDSKPLKEGYCATHAHLRLGPGNDDKVVMTESKKTGGCREPGCHKTRSIKGMCVVHARQNLDPATFGSLYRAIKACRAPGCQMRYAMKTYCRSHARQRLEPHVFERLDRPFKVCKLIGCRKHVGARGRGGFCLMHSPPQLPSDAVMASTSPGDHADATVSGETSDIRTRNSDSDDDATVAATGFPKSIRAPKDTSNSDEHPDEKQENEEEVQVAHGQGERACCGLLRGKYAELESEYAHLQSEYEKLRLLLQKREEDEKMSVLVKEASNENDDPDAASE